MKSSNLTLVIHSLQGGGAERQFTYLANHLASLGYHCTVITLGKKDSDHYQLDASIQRICLDLLKPSPTAWHGIVSNLWRAIRMRSAVKHAKPNLVISFCDQMNVLILLATLGLRAPVVVCERSNPQYQKMSAVWEWLRRTLYPRAKCCVVQTQSVGNYLHEMIPSIQTMEVIPSAVAVESHPTGNIHEENASSGVAKRSLRDASHPSIDLDLQPATKLVLYAGRLSSEKGPDRLLEAWNPICDQHKDWKLVFVGDGSLRASLEHAVVMQQMGEQVHFAGWQKDVWPWLHQSEIVVLPSHYEGYPGIVLEAMAAGAAVIATRCSPAIEEIITHGVSGLIAENSIESIRANLQVTIEDESLRRLLQQNGRDAIKRYEWSKLAPRWEAIVKQFAK